VEKTYESIARAAEGASVPIVVNCLGAPSAEPQVHLADGNRLPVFPFPEPAVRALGRAIQYAEWRRRPQGVVPELDRIDIGPAQTVVRRLLERRPEGGWLDPQEAEELMRSVGVGVLPAEVVDTRADAVGVAHRLGYPIAVKTAAEGIVHKTDIGGVRVGITGRHDAGEAYDSVTRAAGDPRVVVQAMAPRGVELMIGLVRDPLFGPVLMAGSGGVLTDLLADRRWRGLPLTDLDATEMLRSLRCAPMLAGYRGAEPADEKAVLDLLHRVARLAELVPEVAELDINPLVAAPAGAFAVDVKVRIAPARPEADPYSRRLR
jgi:acyl-CoA synthetase (NDP forming)